MSTTPNNENNAEIQKYEIEKLLRRNKYGG